MTDPRDALIRVRLFQHPTAGSDCSQVGRHYAVPWPAPAQGLIDPPTAGVCQECLTPPFFAWDVWVNVSDEPVTTEFTVTRVTRSAVPEGGVIINVNGLDNSSGGLCGLAWDPRDYGPPPRDRDMIQVTEPARSPYLTELRVNGELRYTAPPRNEA